MRRSKHSLSHYKLLTCDMGELVPIACFDVLPGDSIQQATSALIRVSPMVAPVMHPVSVRIHHWFVPYRLLWDDWESFITGGSDGEGDGSVFPYRLFNSPGQGTLLDYLGVPDIAAGPASLSMFPMRAYNLIFNEFYRDQDLVTERVVSTAGGADATTDVTLAKVAWEKDYFTSARPWAQKGPQVTLPLGTYAPVISDGNPLALTDTGGAKNLVGGIGTPAVDAAANWPVGGTLGYASGLRTDLTNATAVSVNAVREAFALQRYQEARALFGSRYTEYLRYLGIRSSDARLQRPEYLGGGKQTIAFTEVLQTGPDSLDEGVASLKGHGISALRTRRYRRFVEEHGVVLSLLSVRPRTMYGHYLDRSWSKRTKEDYFQRELESIGQQEVYSREVFAEADAAGAGGDAVFGYANRYAEYRHQQSTIAGEFRSTLDYWHMARLLAVAPTLNASFVTADPTKRIYASTNTDALLLMVSNSIQARRMVSRSSIGRIL